MGRRRRPQRNQDAEVAKTQEKEKLRKVESNDEENDHNDTDSDSDDDFDVSLCGKNKREHRKKRQMKVEDEEAKKTKKKAIKRVTTTATDSRKRRRSNNSTSVTAPEEIADIEEVHAKLLACFPHVTDAMKRFDSMREVMKEESKEIMNWSVVKSETIEDDKDARVATETTDRKLLVVKTEDETTTVTTTVTGAAPGLCGGSRTVVEALVSTILSQNTSDRNSSRAVTALKQRFGTDCNAVLDAPAIEVEETIRCGGLAGIKTARIRTVLELIRNEQKSCKEENLSLEFLRGKSTEEVKEYLSRFPGVGPKTISCVLLFCMGRDDFPVDTHVHRVTKRLGWVDPDFVGADRGKTYELLNNKIPDHLKHSLHILLINHGRKTCKAGTPQCDKCPLQSNCKFYQSQVDL